MIKIENTQTDDNSNKKSKKLDVDIFNPITFQKLNLSVCDNTSINIYTPIVMSEKQKEIYKNLVEEGYDPFDLSDKIL